MSTPLLPGLPNRFHIATAAMIGLALLPLPIQAQQQAPLGPGPVHPVFPRRSPEATFYGLDILDHEFTEHGYAVVSRRSDRFVLRVLPHVQLGTGLPTTERHRYQFIVTVHELLPDAPPGTRPKQAGRWTSPIMVLGPGDRLDEVIEDSYPIKPGHYQLTVSFFDHDDRVRDAATGQVRQGTELAAASIRLIVPKP